MDQYTSMKLTEEISQHTKIECWKSDNAGKNTTTTELFEEIGFGIEFELTARKTPPQNGMVQRAFATLYGRMRAMFTNAGLEQVKSKTLWAECAATATKLDNILVKAGDKKSPYQKVYGKNT